MLFIKPAIFLTFILFLGVTAIPTEAIASRDDCPEIVGDAGAVGCEGEVREECLPVARYNDAKAEARLAWAKIRKMRSVRDNLMHRHPSLLDELEAAKKARELDAAAEALKTFDDALANICGEDDSDEDGIVDIFDACYDQHDEGANYAEHKGCPSPTPETPPDTNTDTDTDTDTNTDTDNSDTDKDGIADEEDNCPETYNPDQADRDENGIGNFCDDPPPAGTYPNESLMGIDGEACSFIPYETTFNIVSLLLLGLSLAPIVLRRRF